MTQPRSPEADSPAARGRPWLRRLCSGYHDGKWVSAVLPVRGLPAKGRPGTRILRPFLFSRGGSGRAPGWTWPTTRLFLCENGTASVRTAEDVFVALRVPRHARGSGVTWSRAPTYRVAAWRRAFEAPRPPRPAVAASRIGRAGYAVC